MKHSAIEWINECLQWADEIGFPVSLNRLSGACAEQGNTLDQSMSTARWVQAYLEWIDEECGNVVHVGFRKQIKFDRRVAIQPFCAYARRASDRQVTLSRDFFLLGDHLRWQCDQALAA